MAICCSDVTPDFWRRERSWSGQRLFASVVLPRPSVMESPMMAKAAVVLGNQASTAEMKYLYDGRTTCR